MRGDVVLAVSVGLLFAIGLVIGYSWAIMKMRQQGLRVVQRERIERAAPYRYRMQQYIRAEEQEARRGQRSRRERARDNRAHRSQGVRSGRAVPRQLERPPTPTTTPTPPERESSSSPPPRYTPEDENAVGVLAMLEARPSLELLLPVHMRVRTYLTMLPDEISPPPYGEGDHEPPDYEHHREEGGSVGQGGDSGSIVSRAVRWAMGSRAGQQVVEDEEAAVGVGEEASAGII